MIIVGTFQPSIEIERALFEMEALGVPPEEMMVLYMNEIPPISRKKRLLPIFMFHLLKLALPLLLVWL
ncbi:hypothetical protein AAHH67_02095 [Niallia circulans]